jgi:hypothetical protein
MLPFFFRHYDPLVDRYFIYDDGSTDGTRSLLERHEKVELRRFERAFGDSFVLSQNRFWDQCWKESRRDADWVIVADLDEHLFHPALQEYLLACSARGVTLIPALGFQMISEQVPANGEHLATSYRLGMPWRMMQKASIFNPNEIEEINFGLGRHTARPSGRVQLPERDEMLLLHYKYLGYKRTLKRQQELRGSLRRRDLQEGWGRNYSWSEDEFRKDWRTVAANAIDYLGASRDPKWRYPIPVWWEDLRKSKPGRTWWWKRRPKPKADGETQDA